jgi:transposase
MNNGLKIDGRRLPPDVMDHLRRVAVHAVVFENKTPTVVAAVLGFCRASIYNWLSRYREDSLLGLNTKRAPGAEAKITPQMDLWLKDTVLQTTPEQHNYDTRLWTRAILAELLKKRFRVTVDETTVGRHLKRLDISCQKPEYRAVQQDEESVRKFREEKFPRIIEMAANFDADIVFLDEAGIGMRTRSGRTWGLCGQTPQVKAVDGKAGFNLLSSVGLNGEMQFSVKEGTVNSEKFIGFLEQLIRYRDRLFIVIMDQASYHKSKQTKAYMRSNRDRMRVFFLPVYAPEINPDEQVWNETKDNRIGKQPVKNKEDLKRRIYRAFQSLQKTPDRIKSFFKLKNTRYIIEVI